MHEAIAVDTSAGVETFGFGPAASPHTIYGDFIAPVIPITGRIDNGPNEDYSSIKGGVLVSSYYLSTVEGDEVVQGLKRMQQNPPNYQVVGLGGINCNQFANMVVSRVQLGNFSLPSMSPLDTNIITNLFK